MARRGCDTGAMAVARPAFLLSAVLAATLGTALPAAAQLTDRRDFERMLEAAAPMAARSWPLVRCAGLTRATRRHLGRAVLGREGWDTLRQRDAALTRAAALVRAQDYGQPWRSATLQAEVDVDAVARLYRTRFEAAIAETGLPWERDPVWSAHAALCDRLIDAARISPPAPDPPGDGLTDR